MISLNDLTKLHNLPVSSMLNTYLMNELIEQPFDDLVDANQFWQETSTQLFFLEPLDQLEILEACLPAHHLHQLTHCPEYIQTAPDNYFLALIVTGQAGGGYYLLFPDNTKIQELQPLKEIAE